MANERLFIVVVVFLALFLALLLFEPRDAKYCQQARRMQHHVRNNRSSCIVVAESAKQRCQEFVGGHIGLLENAAKSANLYRPVHWHRTTAVTASHDDMAATLSDLNEAQLFERFDALAPANLRQLGYWKPRTWSPKSAYPPQPETLPDKVR